MFYKIPREDTLRFFDEFFVDGVQAVAKSDILKALLHPKEDGTYSFYYSSDDMENTQIELIVKELKDNGISIDSYIIKTIDEVASSETYDEYMYRN